MRKVIGSTLVNSIVAIVTVRIYIPSTRPHGDSRKGIGTYQRLLHTWNSYRPEVQFELLCWIKKQLKARIPAEDDMSLESIEGHQINDEDDLMRALGVSSRLSSPDDNEPTPRKRYYFDREQDSQVLIKRPRASNEAEKENVDPADDLCDRETEEETEEDENSGDEWEDVGSTDEAA